MQYFDAPAVRKIVHDAAANDYKFSSLVLGVAKSAPFQMRTVKGGKEEPMSVYHQRGVVAENPAQGLGTTLALPMLDSMMPRFRPPPSRPRLGWVTFRTGVILGSIDPPRSAMVSS
jgi:hypothetical protein